VSALHLGRFLKNTLFLKLDPQPLSAINGVRLDVRARRRSLLTSPHPRRRLSPKCARKSALGASAFNAAVGRRYLGGTSRRSSRGGGHKEGPDELPRTSGPRTFRDTKLGPATLLRLKFCPFDDPGAIPCPLRKVLVDANGGKLVRAQPSQPILKSNGRTVDPGLKSCDPMRSLRV
jgi:hypothetical protein